MTRTVTTVAKQVKMLEIYSPYKVVEGKDWYSGEFTTQEEADAIFEDIMRQYREDYKGSWLEPPKMYISWKTVSVDETVSE